MSVSVLYKILKTLVNHQKSARFPATLYNTAHEFRLCQQPRWIIGIAQDHQIQMQQNFIQNIAGQSISIPFLQFMIGNVTAHNPQGLLIFGKCGGHQQRMAWLQGKNQSKDQFGRPISTDQPFCRHPLIL